MLLSFPARLSRSQADLVRERTIYILSASHSLPLASLSRSSFFSAAAAAAAARAPDTVPPVFTRAEVFSPYFTSLSLSILMFISLFFIARLYFPAFFPIFRRGAYKKTVDKAAETVYNPCKAFFLYSLFR